MRSLNIIYSMLLFSILSTIMLNSAEAIPNPFAAGMPAPSPLFNRKPAKYKKPAGEAPYDTYCAFCNKQLCNGCQYAREDINHKVQRDGKTVDLFNRTNDPSNGEGAGTLVGAPKPRACGAKIGMIGPHYTLSHCNKDAVRQWKNQSN